MEYSKYIVLSVFLVLVGGVMAIMPNTGKEKEVTPEVLLTEINYDNRFWSTDRVAKDLIEADPLLLLVDVRTSELYAEFHLPGAINIPLSDLLNDDWLGFFNQDIKEIVLYSNGTIYANQSWMLLRRKNVKNIYIMQGGLNKWVETILQPKAPMRTASVAEHDLYSFRKGASLFFGKGGVEQSDRKVKEMPVIPVRRKKKSVQGGC